MTRYGTVGESSGPEHKYVLDREARLARLVGAADGEFVRHLQDNPWVRIVAGHPLNWYWTAAEGTVEVSAPSQEPGDEIGQELLATGLVGSVGGPERTQDGRYAELVEERIAVIRVHILDVYGARCPESEHWYEEPTYW
ncbi:hypothetical protein [Streptomyces sp. NPDC047981]|uniref:hypothetical protein n=1 Tax=Streptomyces sp. NPDC047981 TaxID=3154610 RepID=UPI00341C10DE